MQQNRQKSAKYLIQTNNNEVTDFIGQELTKKYSRKMPRCLMAKKFKAYTWPTERTDAPEEEEEEIDVVGDSPATATSCWAPSSPTEGATAPSPPPTSPHGTTLLYNGK